MEKEKPVMSIAVSKTYLVGLIINEDIPVVEQHDLEFRVTQGLSIDYDKEILNQTITFTFKSKLSESISVEVSSRNLFHVIGIAKAALPAESAAQMNLPREPLITCLSLSLSHTRVFLSQAICNTIYRDAIRLPVFNPTELAKTLYPEVEIRKVVTAKNIKGG
jgi:hypothetical protein